MKKNEESPLPRKTLITKAMILDAIDEKLDLKRIDSEDDMISVALYAIMEMYHREQGDDGIFNIAEYWKRIKETEKVDS